MTGLFEAIRERVTARQAAEAYGLAIHANGRALCPWHEDHHPDLRFYDNGACYCFACHSGGDAVALTARLHGETMLEAARRINADFRLGLDADAPVKPSGPSEAERRRAQREADRRRWGTLCEIVRQADGRLAAFVDGSAWDDPGFVGALRARSRAELALDNEWAEVTARGRAG